MANEIATFSSRDFAMTTKIARYFLMTAIARSLIQYPQIGSPNHMHCTHERRVHTPYKGNVKATKPKRAKTWTLHMKANRPKEGHIFKGPVQGTHPNRGHSSAWGAKVRAQCRVHSRGWTLRARHELEPARQPGIAPPGCPPLPPPKPAESPDHPTNVAICPTNLPMLLCSLLEEPSHK